MIDTRMQKLTKNEHGRNIVNYSWIQVCRNSEKNSTFPFFQHLFSILNSCDKLKVFCSIVHFSVPASDCRPIDVQTKLSNLESKARSKSCFSKTTWLELHCGVTFQAAAGMQPFGKRES